MQSLSHAKMMMIISQYVVSDGHHPTTLHRMLR